MPPALRSVSLWKDLLKQEKEHGRSALAVVAALAEADEVSQRGQGDAGWCVSP